MSPKVNTNPTKLASIISWFHKSGTAHSIKDLEKALPSVGSISGMHVKEYLQALVDENKIKVEKIGSGNWYWAFPSEERLNLESAIAKETAERDRAKAVLDDLRAKVDATKIATEDNAESDRQKIIETHDALEKEVEALKDELSTYKDNDPVVLQQKRADIVDKKAQAEKWTDQIIEMESWIVGNMGIAKEDLLLLKQQLYGIEYDEEEEGLKEL